MNRRRTRAELLAIRDQAVRWQHLVDINVPGNLINEYNVLTLKLAEAVPDLLQDLGVGL